MISQDIVHGVSVLTSALRPDPILLAVGVVADFAIGDPAYRWHPVRLIGRGLTWIEARLRRARLDGYGGGVLLFVLLAATSLGVLLLGLVAATSLGLFLSGAAARSTSFGGATPSASSILMWLLHAFLLYSFLALGDLLHHVRRIERAVRAGDLDRARTAVSALVGRDTDRMDGAACRRAAVESLSENLTDGFVSPVFWYTFGGLPGLVLFKVVSTMDSMVGYKTPRYLQFGWAGARLDDVMNYAPARLTWVVISVLALLLPSYSGRKAWRVGLRQHALLLGPNSGWSEAATAGALQRRIVGPIWLKGVQVTDLWIGEPTDPPLATAGDLRRAEAIAVASGLIVAAAACVLLHRFT